MNTGTTGLWDEGAVLHKLEHYLPAQAPLKNFVHHNTLHAWQHLPFFDGCRLANQSLGYKTSLNLHEFRAFYTKGQIKEETLRQTIQKIKGTATENHWFNLMVNVEIHPNQKPRIGLLRQNWKKRYKIDLDSLVYPLLFRLLCSYLDQGISIWNFPVHQDGLLASLRELERNSVVSIFKGKRAKEFLQSENLSIPFLLERIVGDPALYEQYLFDQQFGHQGWSGITASIEASPESLLDPKPISLKDLILVELLMELDVLDHQFGPIWAPLSTLLESYPLPLFEKGERELYDEVLELWQLAMEWSYYNPVLSGISWSFSQTIQKKTPRFQGLFCIDDRECSFRRHLEDLAPACETFGTPGFFNVAFYFRPFEGKFLDKVCPAPVFPNHLIVETEADSHSEEDAHFHQRSHSLWTGWLTAQLLAPWTALKLLNNLFRPSMSAAAASSFKHMHHATQLKIEADDVPQLENGLQLGFTVEEMADRVLGQLNSIGFTKNFADLVYVVGHGSSSINNPYYAAYDCGACSGRPGSVNARVFAFMANHEKVRELLKQKGISIPESTRFVSALHDTASDDIVFYDIESLPENLKQQHQENEKHFIAALDINAKERSRRLVSSKSKGPAALVHSRIRKRVVSLFEPRPELNHASNCLCIIGSRRLTRNVYLDRRAFLNSYDPKNDPDGSLLLGILKAAAPVCGGINLEYYFSRVDNQKLGAGSKLPHNVMGLIGLANGADGDLRPGLPSQMIEIHDPLRLLMIIEQVPERILTILNQSPETASWFINEWIILTAIHPETGKIYLFKNRMFQELTLEFEELPLLIHEEQLYEEQEGNLPVFIKKGVEA